MSIHATHGWGSVTNKWEKNINYWKTVVSGAQIQLWSCRIETMSSSNSHAHHLGIKQCEGLMYKQTEAYMICFFNLHFCEKKKLNINRNGCLAFLSLQLNISPNVVKQQRPSHGSFPRKDRTASTCARRKLIQLSVRLFNFNNMALSDWSEPRFNGKKKKKNKAKKPHFLILKSLQIQRLPQGVARAAISSLSAIQKKETRYDVITPINA